MNNWCSYLQEIWQSILNAWVFWSQISQEIVHQRWHKCLGWAIIVDSFSLITILLERISSTRVAITIIRVRLIFWHESICCHIKIWIMIITLLLISRILWVDSATIFRFSRSFILHCSMNFILGGLVHSHVFKITNCYTRMQIVTFSATLFILPDFLSTDFIIYIL